MSDAPIKINPEGGVTSTGNKIEDTARYLPPALKAIEERYPTSFSLIAIVGYVLIAAFGKMDTKGKYFGYISFLVLSFVFYKIASRKKASK